MTFIIPFFISALMGMGVGGGGLLIIYLTLILEKEQYIAQGTNLFLFVISGLGSFLIHFKKRKIKISLVLTGAFFGILGTLLSSHFLTDIDPKYAKICLGIVLIISGLLTLYNTLIKRVAKKFKKTLYK